MATKQKPSPPPAPRLPTKADLMAAAERKAQGAPQDQEEQDEATPVAQIREHMDAINDLLDQIEEEE